MGSKDNRPLTRLHMWAQLSVCLPMPSMRSHPSAVLCALLFPTSCTLWPPTYLWSAVKRARTPPSLSFNLQTFTSRSRFWARSHSAWASDAPFEAAPWSSSQMRDDPFGSHSNQKTVSNTERRPDDVCSLLIKVQNAMESEELIAATLSSVTNFLLCHLQLLHVNPKQSENNQKS